MILIPRDESNPNFDVLGSPLDFAGRVPYDAKLLDVGTGIGRWLGNVAVDNSKIVDESLGLGTDRARHGGWWCDFDGTTGYIDCGTGVGDFGAGDFTIEGWIEVDGAAATRTIAAKGSINATDWVFGITGGNLRFYADGGSINITGSTSLVAGTRYHVAVIRASGVVTIYLDGSSEGSDATATADIGDNAHALTIGAREDGTESFWDGKIGQLRIYSADESSQLSTMSDRSLISGTKKTVAIHSTNNTNLVAGYPSEEQSGTTSYDISGNGHHGTHNGGVTHVEDADAPYSRTNEEGYNLSGVVYIPARDDNLAADGSVLTVTGMAPYPLMLEDSHCATFDGTNDTIEMGSSYEPETFTFRSRLYIDSSSGNQVIFSNTRNTGGPYSGCQLHIRSSESWRPRFYVWDGVGSANYFFTNSLPLDEWCDIGLSFNNSTREVKSYINGVPDGSSTISRSIASPASFDLYIGRMGITTLWFIKGQIAQLGFHSSIIDLSGTDFNDFDELNFRFGEGSGLTIYDSSGSGRNGSADGMTSGELWANTQNVYHGNLLYGFTDVSGIKIPAIVGSDLDAQGNPVGNPGSDTYHNGAETQINFAPLLTDPLLLQIENQHNISLTGLQNYSFGDTLPEGVGKISYSGTEYGYFVEPVGQSGVNVTSSIGNYFTNDPFICMDFDPWGAPALRDLSNNYHFNEQVAVTQFKDQQDDYERYFYYFKVI